MSSHGGDLKLLGIRKAYGAAVAVEDLTLEIKSGEFVTLLGPSGSGKTTTLGMIAGFIEPDCGEIFINGKCVTKAPAYHRGLGVVFQNYALFPLLTVYENLAFPLRVRRQSKAEIRRRVTRMLELVGLGGFAERTPRQLSGGQQQRVALARALVYDPPVLLMDEPLGALDKKLREHLQYEIKELQRRLGVTVIYVTHDQEEALVMSDRIALMNKGRVEQLGAPAELYHRSANEFVADFIGQSNLLAGTVSETSKGRCKIQLECGLMVVADTESDWPAGNDVTLIVRPESIRLSSNAKPGDNSFASIVTSIAFIGDSTKYTVQLDGGQSLGVRLQQGNGSFSQGDRVTISWHPASGRLIQASRH